MKVEKIYQVDRYSKAKTGPAENVGLLDSFEANGGIIRGIFQIFAILIGQIGGLWRVNPAQFSCHPPTAQWISNQVNFANFRRTEDSYEERKKISLSYFG